MGNLTAKASKKNTIANIEKVLVLFLFKAKKFSMYTIEKNCCEKTKRVNRGIDALRV
jgi:hypothetical protein